MEPKPAPARIRDAAIVVPVAGLLLLMPPLLPLFAAPASVFGIPLVVCALFGIWVALVVSTWWLARQLAGSDGPPPEP